MIPTYEQIMLPFLEKLQDGKVHKLSDLVDNLSDDLNLTEEEKRTLLPSGKQPLFRNRVGWARTYLSKAKLVEVVKRAHFKITDRGLKVLQDKPHEISAHYLTQFQEFVDFITPKAKGDETRLKISGQTPVELKKDSGESPQESLEYAYLGLKTELSNELLSLVKDGTPAFFETLVIDLITSMGYGGSRRDAGEAIGKSGDGGIDGIIKEDKLGLDIIYIQAKKWENTVPVKEVRDFAGALLSKKAKKGIFITTSGFPKKAYEYVGQIEPKIILIDGSRLTELMIEYNVGLSVAQVYEVKKIDSDYFEET